MSDCLSFTIRLTPRTKKNSQRIVRQGGRIIPLPSKAFCEYQAQAAWFVPRAAKIDYPVEVTAKFFMPTRRIVDLVGLLQGLDDLLVHYGVIADDNSRIIVSHDGSRVLYDKTNPRTEVEIRRINADLQTQK